MVLAGSGSGSGSAAPHDGEAEGSQKAGERTGTMTLPVHQSAVVEPEKIIGEALSWHYAFLLQGVSESNHIRILD